MHYDFAVRRDSPYPPNTSKHYAWAMTNAPTGTMVTPSMAEFLSAFGPSTPLAIKLDQADGDLTPLEAKRLLALPAASQLNPTVRRVLEFAVAQDYAVGVTLTGESALAYRARTSAAST